MTDSLAPTPTPMPIPKTVEPTNLAEAKNDAVKTPASVDEPDQPWKALVDVIDKENKNNPVGADFFPCEDGFYAHSLAA
ncbi:hypothetical protein NW759_014613 [Fusarium solani]|nr:hypothetical protein NW759_014613 [Fusarium solani]